MKAGGCNDSITEDEDGLGWIQLQDVKEKKQM
jgi:hypothetical protein